MELFDFYGQNIRVNATNFTISRQLKNRMSCNEDAAILTNRVLISVSSYAAIVITLSIGIIALIVIHVTLAVESCIERTSKQLLEQTVLREEAPDYYLGEDTKYYTYIPAEDDKPPTNAPAPVEPAPGTDDLLQSGKKLKDAEKK